MSTAAPGWSLQAADPLQFLRGHWRADRLLADHGSGQDGQWHGRAAFVPMADGPELAYREDGELWFGGHHGPAGRSLRYAELPDRTVAVRFADGRDFYVLDLSSGSCAVRHQCGQDTYDGTVTVLDPGRFTEHWVVHGPDKDYEISTTFARAEPAGSDR